MRSQVVSLVATLTTGRVTPKSFMLGGNMYVVGGRSNDFSENGHQRVPQILPTVERYCPNSDTWSEVREFALDKTRYSFEIAVLTVGNKEANVLASFMTKVNIARQ